MTCYADHSEDLQVFFCSTNAALIACRKCQALFAVDMDGNVVQMEISLCRVCPANSKGIVPTHGFSPQLRAEIKLGIEQARANADVQLGMMIFDGIVGAPAETSLPEDAQSEANIPELSDEEFHRLFGFVLDGNGEGDDGENSVGLE